MSTTLKTDRIGHLITRPIRRALMLSLWVAFFIITPTIILYTAGYRYDFTTGEVNILVGTQMVTKGLDFKNVGPYCNLWK